MEAKTTKRAAGYIRVSTLKSVEGESLEVQKKAIKKYTDYHGYQLTKIYSDKGFSGVNVKDRPEVQQLLMDGQNGKFDVVIIWKLDRFGRNSIELQINYELLQKHGVDLASVTEQMDFSTPQGKFYLQMLSAVAEMERQSIKERMLAGRIHKASSGIPTTKKFPFGRTFNFEEKKWEIDKKKKKAIEWVAKDYLKGEKLIDLVDQMNANNDFKLGYDGLRNVLKNHCGPKWYQRFNGQDPIEFDIHPLLDDDIIEKVKERMAFNKRCNRTDKRDYLLSGFIRCEKCNYALSGANSNGRRVYQHSNKVNGKQKFCMSLNADMIEWGILDTLIYFFGDKANFEKAIEKSLPDVNKKQELVTELKLKNKTIEKINRELLR